LSPGCDEQQLIRDPQTSTDILPSNSAPSPIQPPVDLLPTNDHRRGWTQNIHFVAESLQLSDREATSPHSMLR
jgi:hypothetical protein